MKLLIRLSSIFLALILSFAAFSQDKSTEEKGIVDTKMLVIKGDNAWLKTGFLLKQTDRVEISAIGQVFFSDGNNLSGVTPNGMAPGEFEANWPLDYLSCEDPANTINHAALIGKTGNSIFLIGKNKTITGKKGPLVIGINDCTFKEKCFNTGEFKVNVKVYRGK